MKLTISKKQYEFINADADEVLFGGAAGGGKSHGQLIDALLYALKYEKSKQVIFRRTFPELEKSIIRTALSIYPQEIYKYNSSSHTITFLNGSIIDFAYCDTENDVYKYQSAEFDVIRFDELTHFSESMYTYMISRLRGANAYPKHIKSSTNPGGVGHTWVKDRFINIGEANTVHNFESGSRIFIPSFVYDNSFLLENDPDYVNRLKNLSEKDMKQLLYGDWDTAEGRYFTEFSRDIHVIHPFPVHKEWRIYRALDYGLDMLAVLWFAVDSMRNVYVFKELHKPNLTISEACDEIKAMTDEDIYITYAPPDLWSRSQESGRARSDLFTENGLYITKSNNNREAGWLCVKELLKPNANGEPRIKIFSNCINLIKHLPEIQIDKHRPNDCATEPHEITHILDALRYFAVQYITPAKTKTEQKSVIDTDLERRLKRIRRI